LTPLSVITIGMKIAAPWIQFFFIGEDRGAGARRKNQYDSE
jgi:hypothetical protein